MVVKIRLARFGKRHAPFYNIVVAQARYVYLKSYTTLPYPSLKDMGFSCCNVTPSTVKLTLSLLSSFSATILQISKKLEADGSHRHV